MARVLARAVPGVVLLCIGTNLEYRYQPVIMQTLRDCTTQVAKHDWCFWLRGLAMMHAIGLGLKFIIGIICLIAFVRYGGGLSG